MVIHIITKKKLENANIQAKLLKIILHTHKIGRTAKITIIS